MAKKARLNIKQVESLMRRPGVWPVGEGLYLQVHNAHSKSWVLRYQIANVRRSMGLGSCDLVTVAEAFAAAHEARRLARAGRDPIEARKAERESLLIEKAKGISFKAAAEQYVEMQTASWTNHRVAGIWRASLEQHAYDVLGSVPVAAVDTAMVQKVLHPIWLSKSPTGKRVRARIEAILEWCKVKGFRTGENPARWKGHLALLLPKQTHSVEHRAALAYAEAAAFMQNLREQTGPAARALELTVLVALRTSEVLGAKWDEIDFGQRVWTVPAARMKMRKEHRVPLSDAALAALREMAKVKDGPFIFPAMRGSKDRPVSDKVMRDVLKDMGRTDIDVHGFRSTFRDWASETTGHDANVCELALGHAIKSEVERAYRRGDLFEKRRALMNDWASFCAGLPAQDSDKVVSIRGRQ